MSISISLEEYELCQSFNFQLEEKKKELTVNRSYIVACSFSIEK